MATPRKINIEFNATGNLKTAIKAIAKEYQKFQKQNQKVSASTSKVSKSTKENADTIKLNIIEFQKFDRKNFERCFNK